ncbi:MAG: L-seryl-tRNA(Sec) selenium transferase [Myxococcaceae bacterium]|nr:L-seryl-tRNA(Sec) selenium transferase [Myxococcaceae bacterium]MCI0670029.1 L-seryl-tRNA(Sec) selenium transferase [Myxococcaceae bacterium]
MEDNDKNVRLRALPSVEAVLQRASLGEALGRVPRSRAVAAIRLAVDTARTRLLEHGGPGFADADVHSALAHLSQPRLRPVLNATGVVLHTNLGRAPLSAHALERLQAVAGGYTNLEYDLEEGERGSRYAPVVDVLRELTGAEDAVVVNNCAGAVLLVLAALGAGREGVVSRGELIEIGGGFRIPDVMRQSGVRLVEVGTTNRTRLDDYAGALTPETALLVKVHRGNFAQVGFTSEVPVTELSRLGQERGLPVVVDLGTGALVPLRGVGLTAEPTVSDAVEAGADVVTFSGDKLLGGPQAGIIVGGARWIERVRSHPLNRALRVDKLTVAALEATLELYRDERWDDIPALRLLSQPPELLRRRAMQLASLLASRGVAASVEDVVGQVGGGAMPLAAPPSSACCVDVEDPADLLEGLRKSETPVIGRLLDGRAVFDVRCLGESQLEAVAAAICAVLGDESA